MRRYRTAVQAGFFALSVFLGFRLWRFTLHYETRGAAPYLPHPDGAAGFLPIGGLTSVKYWIVNGRLHPVHPAAAVIFAAAVVVSVLLKKGFCGWICPVGFISDRLYRPWRRLFGRNLRLPGWLDYPMRSVKYLILAFFFWAIIIAMDGPAVSAFLDGDYWKVADIKMLKFFTEISVVSFYVIGLLVLLSVPVRNFWCRYLCPYGALLGIAGLVSPFEITRDDDRCVHCMKCTRDCPQHLPVEARAKIVSPECTSCLTCLSGCPKDAITYATPGRGGRLPGWAYPVALLAVFLGMIGAAKLTGHWHTGVTDAQYRRLAPIAGSLRHP